MSVVLLPTHLSSVVSYLRAEKHSIAYKDLSYDTQLSFLPHSLHPRRVLKI
jgi:hypothetical protein